MSASALIFLAPLQTLNTNMRTYTEFLTEANIGKLKHLTHLPEAILHLGFDGARESINILRTLRDEFSGKSNEKTMKSQKWDGAPALIFGYDPADKQFFVGTKGVFAKDAKLVKTTADLDTFGYSGELRNKLQVALDNMPKIMKGNKGVYQGDMMFTKGDPKVEKIDGTSYLSFTPNTITYAIPANSDLAKTIKSANIGIVIHTTYTGGETLEDMTAQPGQVDITNFKKNPDVWFDDPYVKDVSGKVTMTASETVEVTRYLSEAGKVFQSMSKREVNGVFAAMEQLPSSAAGAKIDTFINSLVRNNTMPKPGQGKHYAEMYRSYLKDYWETKVIGKLKSEKGKQQKREFYSEWIGQVDFRAIAKIIDFMSYVNEAMLLIMAKLNEGIGSMKTFVWTGDGYRVTSGEGFVVSDKLSGNTWKIVDRLDFSAANFGMTAKFGTRG